MRILTSPVTLYSMIQHPHGKPSRVPNYIRAWRRHRRMSMEALGEALGKTKNTISRWERQLGSPTIDDLHNVADFLDCTVIDLLSRHPDIEMATVEMYARLPQDERLIVDKVVRGLLGGGIK